MGKLRIAMAEFNYKELQAIKRTIIHGLKSNNMLIGTIHKLIAIKDTCVVPSRQVLDWLGELNFKECKLNSRRLKREK